MRNKRCSPEGRNGDEVTEGWAGPHKLHNRRLKMETEPVKTTTKTTSGGFLLVFACFV